MSFRPGNVAYAAAAKIDFDQLAKRELTRIAQQVLIEACEFEKESLAVLLRIAQSNQQNLAVPRSGQPFDIQAAFLRRQVCVRA